MIFTDLADACKNAWPHSREFLRQMVAINSFTANADGVNHLGQFVAAQFAALDFTASFPPTPFPNFGNHLVLRRPLVEGKPTIALIAHLDTVFPAEEEKRNAFHWQEVGDRLYGPGTNDIKGGIAGIHLMLSAMAATLPELYQQTNWVILCNACEEVDSKDFGELCVRELPADTRACLIFEADGGERSEFSLVTARKGRATFRVEVSGRGAHAGGQHARGVNAIVQLARTIGELDQLTNYEVGLTVNLGRMNGGTVLNRVPEQAVAELEMRAFLPEVFSEARRAILAQAGEGTLRSRDDSAQPARIEVQILDETPPWPRNPATDALMAHWQTAGQELGYEVEPQERGGLSDGNVIWNHFPTLDGLGPRGDHCHCSENDPSQGKFQEFADATSFVPKAILNLRAIARLLAF